MPFEERQRLVLAYRGAVQAYNEAGASFDHTTFQDALQRMEQARKRVDAARSALLKHEHLDGPQAKDESPNRIATNGSSVVLFNVNTERWVLFEAAECGTPPERALAYAPLPDHQQGEWIVDARDMAARERQNVKLYFTEAGLAILREAGLEM